MGHVGGPAGSHSELQAADGSELVGDSAHESVHGHLRSPHACHISLWLIHAQTCKHHLICTSQGLVLQATN